MSDKELPDKKEMRKSLSGELRLSASDYDSSERVYEKVRSWYLARLRKAAVEETTRNVNLTPAALIVADREFVERLILEKTNLPKKTMGKAISRRDYVSIVLFSWIGLLVTAMALYCFIDRHGEITSTTQVFYAIGIGRLFGEPPVDLSNFPPYVQFFPLLLVGWPVLGGLIIVLISQLKPREGTG